MRTSAYQDDPASFLRSMGVVAVVSFVAGFSGYMIFGLNLIG